MEKSMASYIPHFIIPDCDHILFEKTALANPHSFYRMNLIQGRLEIMPLTVFGEPDEAESNIIADIVIWCRANRNLVGHHGGSQGAYRLRDGNILGPNASVVLRTRWDALSISDQQKFPRVAPNFVVELRSTGNSPQDVHRKMLLWINAGIC
ncbi:10414_t:CDS:2 [Dentiscutata erythropus]|uniref:10414_t:CDS:1 n=1 Tax=Dentiscutata erythropus TaxID=1348616 RepID=A0A9N9K0A4_9GLOM|nr:10414_t:CDS:2 [Dentiscutata erythropus]